MPVFAPGDEFRSNHRTKLHPWTKHNEWYGLIRVWDSNRVDIRRIPLLRATDRFWETERVSSRHTLRIPLHPLHHIPPMDQTDGMDVHFRGVEAISHKIMAKHSKLRQMSGFGPILDEEVAFSRPSTPNHENHLHHEILRIFPLALLHH